LEVLLVTSTSTFFLPAGKQSFATAKKACIQDAKYLVTSENPTIGHDVLETYWPNVKYSVDSPDHAEFWEHEWDRHGTCSGLDQVTYFTQAINMLRSAKDNLTPLFVQNNVGNFVNVNELRAAFGGPEYVSMVCNGNDLAEVRTCYAKGKDNSVAGRRPCPHNVLGSDDCTSTTVRINSFYVK
jgi:ribonuclease T2